MPIQSKAQKSRFADLDNDNDNININALGGNKDRYADIELSFEKKDDGNENEFNANETDNERDNEFDLEMDIHKSTQNLKLEKALHFYKTAKDKNALVDSLTDNVLNLLLGDEFKSENLKLIDKNFASTYDLKYLQSSDYIKN